MQGAGVLSLEGELISNMPHSAAKNKNKQKNWVNVHLNKNYTTGIQFLFFFTLLHGMQDLGIEPMLLAVGA